jgi:hypothetical protein
MTRQRVPLLACLLVLLASACTVGHDGAMSAPPTSAAASPTTAAPTPAGTPTAGQPTPPTADWRVTYGWEVPSAPARITHRFPVPVTPPPGPPLPTLIEVRVGDHPAEGYSRITFAFRGPTPSYEVAYVRQVEADGSGAPVDLPGNAFLAVRFTQAQAHDGDRHSTVTASPVPAIGYPTLRGWAPAGDFEGHLSFGLGVRTIGAAVPVRLGESTRPDGTHVVSVDLRRG